MVGENWFRQLPARMKLNETTSQRDSSYLTSEIQRQFFPKSLVALAEITSLKFSLGKSPFRSLLKVCVLRIVLCCYIPCQHLHVCSEIPPQLVDT